MRKKRKWEGGERKWSENIKSQSGVRTGSKKMSEKVEREHGIKWIEKVCGKVER